MTPASLRGAAAVDAADAVMASSLRARSDQGNDLSEAAFQAPRPAPAAASLRHRDTIDWARRL
jgi:hypothetical protein